jgi:cytochrome c biogenesis protein CcmG/thiol:disulfide interchange protein DsbE
VVLWVSLAVAVVAAVLVAVLATSGPASQVNAKSPLIGKPAPPIGGPNLLAYAGAPATVNLAGPPGHWVLVNFAASWCVPCQQEMPQLLTFAARHATAGDAQIITVAYQQGDEGALASYFKSRQVAWPVIDDNEAKVSYGVTGIPESYLIDPQGTVVAKLVNGVVADQLDALIAPFTTPSTPAGS